MFSSSLSDMNDRTDDRLTSCILPPIFLVGRFDDHGIPVFVNKKMPVTHALCMFCMQTLHGIICENIALIVLVRLSKNNMELSRVTFTSDPVPPHIDMFGAHPNLLILDKKNRSGVIFQKNSRKTHFDTKFSCNNIVEITMCCPPVDALTYSASVTLSITGFCVLDNHPTGMPPSMCTFPETLR
jgi:hypothetical protein